jgi:hypothetical protein
MLGTSGGLNWSPPTGYVNCPQLFDVIRGGLPLRRYNSVTLRGDYTAATCLVSGFSAPNYSDSTQPTLGHGFYYLTRSRSSSLDPPGSWRVPDPAWQGSPDDTMTACP